MDRHTREHVTELWSLYKLDNNLLASWMSLTAKDAGFVFSNNGEIISSSEYIAIAQYLSNKNVVPPRYMSAILDRTISLRKEVQTM
jgi:hypothetical protein